MPTPKELHVDRFLTNLSVAFVQDNRNFVFDKVFPVVPVQKQTDKYVIFDRGSFWRNDQIKERPLGGRADVAEWAFTDDTYRCVERALAYKIDDRQRENTDDPLDPDRAATRLLQEQMAIDNDRRWVTEFFQTGLWTTEKDGATADFTQFDDTTPTDPVELMDEAHDDILKLTGRRANTLVVGADVHRVIKNMDVVLERIKYTQRGIVNEELLASMFNVDNYFVLRSIQNTANEGQTDSIDWIANESSALGAESMLLCHAAPNAGLETPSAGYTFAWQNLVNGAANLIGSAIMRGRDEFAHSDHLEIRSATDLKLVSADLGVFFTDCLT